MPIARVEGPDGKIHRLEVPEGATPQEIEAFAAQAIPQAQPEKMQVTRPQAAASGALSAVPFGSDIAATVGTLAYGGAAPDVPFWEKQRAAKQMLDQAKQASFEQYPATAIAGAIPAAIPMAAVLPTAQGGSIASRALQNAGIGAGVGAIYGAGEGFGSERITNAIEQGAYGGIAGGVLSPVIDVVSSGAKAVPSLAKRAMSLFAGNKQPVPNINVTVQPSATTGQQLAQSLNQQQGTAAPLSMGQIPLTKGQVTQEMRQQALESGALAGNYGDEALRMAEEARQLQSTAAKNVLQGVAGSELDDVAAVQAASDIKNTLSQSYKAAKARTTAAYNQVGELSQDAPLQIAGDYVRDNVVGSVKEWARKGSNGRPWDLMRSDMGEAKRLYNQAAAFGDMKKVTAINFFRMEDWRGRVSQAIAAAEKGSPQKAFLSGMLDRYDTAMGQLPREAIKSGDEAILSAMEKARTARKTQGVLFERSKLVKDILQNEDLTAEQLGNTIMSLGPRSGSYVRDILRTTTDDAQKQALKVDLRRGLMGQVYGKSLSSEVMQGGSVEGGIEKMISFDKLATQLDNLMKNQTLVKQVFDADQIAALEQARRAATLIKSTKPGSKNYSNTAYTILNAIRTVSPMAASANVFGVGAGSALKAAGEAGAQNELKQALEPVLRGIAEDNASNLINLGVKYGGRIVTGGSAIPSIRENVQKPFLTDAQGNTYTLPPENK